MKKALILTDSENSNHVANRVIEILDKYSVNHQLETVLAQKQIIQIREFVKESNADVIICIAGLSGALPGIVAGITSKPVIGVPVDMKLNGLDAILGMAQTPAGVPVATVGIDNGKNAGSLALRILALKYPEILSQSSRASESSYSEPEEERRELSTTPVAMPDFMTSAAPEDPVTFEKPKEETNNEKRGDWWM